MRKLPSYLVVGRGRWGQTVAKMLHNSGRKTRIFGSIRAEQNESPQNYIDRISTYLQKTPGNVIWLCVPPFENTSEFVCAALIARRNLIIEKPWLQGEKETQLINQLAEKNSLTIGVNYEYCFLDELKNWRSRYFDSPNSVRFSGSFFSSRKNRSSLTPLQNLGSHIVAMHQFATPGAAFGSISCGYSRPEKRNVILKFNHRKQETIDFTTNKERLLDKYCDQFEQSLLQNHEFQLNLRFASQVRDSMLKLADLERTLNEPVA